MIVDWDRIRETFGQWSWLPGSDGHGDRRQAEFERAVRGAVTRFPFLDDPVHLALSGGVDSSVLLFAFAMAGRSVVAHTLVAPCNPDTEFARVAVRAALARGFGVSHVEHLAGGCKDVYELSTGMVEPGRMLVTGDCIDEMLGGYYGHLEDPKGAFERYMSRLVPDHLEIHRRCSNSAGVTVWLPFAEPDVVSACRAFPLRERLCDGERKVPMSVLARSLGVPDEIVRRRKIGLVAVRGARRTGSETEVSTDDVDAAQAH